MIPQIMLHAPQMYGLRTDKTNNAWSRQYPSQAPIEARITLQDPVTELILWSTTTKGGECFIRGLQQGKAYRVTATRLDTSKAMTMDEFLNAD